MAQPFDETRSASRETSRELGRDFGPRGGRAQFDIFKAGLHQVLLDSQSSILPVHPEDALEPRTAYRIMSLGMREGMFAAKDTTAAAVSA